jgi:endonuclease/exonuclease/phosphatase family metal-dependent hydrolase
VNPAAEAPPLATAPARRTARQRLGASLPAVAIALVAGGCGAAEWVATRPSSLRPPGEEVASAGPAEAGAPREIAVLVYNVHGLSWVAARDDPARRSAAIGWLARRYDVVLLQEDFETARAIAAQLPGRTIVHGNGLRLDPRLIAAKVLLLPWSLAVPGFTPPYGSGLTTVLAEPLRATPDGVRRQAYATCDGWLGNRFDCWASKGFLRVRVEVDPGIEIDVYNTHLESGGSPSSIASRRAQLRELAGAIAADSGGRALVVGGDLNLAVDRDGDREDLAGFAAALDLTDTGAGPELPGWRGYERLWVRDGESVRIAVREAGEDRLFVSGDRALSDHPAIHARLAVERAGR